MSTDRWQRLDAIFTEGRQLPPDKRRELVVRACGGDEALETDALSLLAADEASGEFLSSPALDRLARAWASEGWNLRPGERVAAYTIVELLGSGGAGEVWRAKDERLGRDVAVKVLLRHQCEDEQRLQWFAAEARTVGSLNHANILTVYDVGEHRGMPFLVSECLEGKSLRQRLDAGPMPATEVIGVAVDIARGLAAAHVRGIVHRDLKPENTFLRTDGVAKILDFGLAKLASPLEGVDVAASQTMTSVIAGTAGYMAPEQIAGAPADARADLFALGVILYEAVCGAHPFRRASTLETLHAVLTIEPPDLLTVNADVPAGLARIVARLLRKKPEERFQSAIDLVWALENVAAPTTSGAVSVPQTTASAPAESRRRRMLWLAIPAAAALIVVGWAVPDPGRDADPALMQFTWMLPPGTSLDSPPVVSPDSARIAFAARTATDSRLFVRELRSLEAAPVPGSEGARQPFWSPDSRSLGFFANGQLKTVVWPGGAPTVVTALADPRGGSWNRDDTIIFSPDLVMQGLTRVSAGGDRREPITRLDPSKGDTTHSWPTFLPDGVHFLYFLRGSEDERRGVYLGRIDRPATAVETPLFRSDSEAVFVGGGAPGDDALLYVNNGRIELRKFDSTRLLAQGDARTLGDLRAGGNTLYHPMMLSATPHVLAFAESAVPFGVRLAVVDRGDGSRRYLTESDIQNWPRISPDGRRVARQRVDLLRNTPDLWVDDLERRIQIRVTSAADPDIFPVWSPDGTQIGYVSGSLPGRTGTTRMLSIAAADGTGVIRSFPCPAAYCEPTDWSGDGTLLVNVLEGRDINVWLVPADGRGVPRPLLAGAAFRERDARFWPGGRWVAYVSEETGRPEVALRTIDGPTERIAVSADGGAQPVWRRDGRELFFVDRNNQLWCVPVERSGLGTPRLGTPTKPNVPPISFGHWGTQYDTSPDGRRIYLLQRNDVPPPREIRVVVGWRALLN